MIKYVKFLFITLPIVGLGAGFMAYTVANSEPPEQVQLAERATHVSVIAAQARRVRPTIRGFGRVEPARVYEAVTQVSGSADYVNPGLNRGVILPEGSVLLRLSPIDFNLAIAQSKTSIRSAEAKLQELDVLEENYKATLALEQQTLDLREEDLARAERLFASGSIPQTSRDSAMTAVLSQRLRVQSVNSSLALLPTQREVQIEQIAASQVSLEQAELNLARSALTLPYTARVSMVAVAEGEYVRSGTTIAELDGIDAAEVEAQMDIAQLRMLLQLATAEVAVVPFDPSRMTDVIRELNLKATVTLKLGGEEITWDAKMDRITEEIDARSGAVGVVVRVEDAYGAATTEARLPLTQGMFVEVSLSAPPVQGLVLPRSALRDGSVLVADDAGRLQERPITPRLVQDDILVLGDGLKPGAQVIVRPPSPVIPGMLLETHPDALLSARLAEVGTAAGAEAGTGAETGE